MEEADELARLGIKRGNVGALVPVAGSAAVREIPVGRLTAMLPAQDVIRLQAITAIVFVKAAILATAKRPLSNTKP